MASGLLELDGTIDLAQYWPQSSSDADTTKLKVQVVGGFRFRPNDGAPFVVTHAFQGAKVKGTTTVEAVKNGAVTVRLQGIDAPELHYRPTAAVKPAERTAAQKDLYLEWNHEYRQLLAETATVALGQFLNGLGAGPLPCKVRTAVDEPGDVFDTYGRLVGDIYVPTAGGEVNVNRWLVEQGWAFPAYYASMSADEITTLTDLANIAWAADAGVWRDFAGTASTTAFDSGLRYRRPTTTPKPVPNAAQDAGEVMVPKVFRRLSTYWVNRRAKMVSGSFEAYLRSKRSSDTVHLTEEFLDQGAAAAPVRFFDEFVTSGEFTVWPEELVFREKPSTVIGPGGAPVSW